MPIREFFCKPCKLNFEKIYLSRDKFESEKDFTPCPECGIVSEPVIANTGSPQFYGSGFHKTDYRNK
jgi:predicted nucleic acid-binding Zn ribbon protein